MRNVHDNVLQAVGNTPLVRLNQLTRGLKANVYCKLEMLNPGGSVKDRIALQIIEDAEASGALKPGGIVGVVQHRAPDGNDDAWANGSNGYLKRQTVIDILTGAGFELVAESEVNANPADQPSEDDFVWRLPPSFAGTGDDAALKAKYAAIGESNRMTLLFRKPE